MTSKFRILIQELSRGVGAASIAIALLYPGAAMAQKTSAIDRSSVLKLAPADDQAGSGESETDDDIIVTGTRIERVGFDQPTPTTVIGVTELRSGARPNIQEVLNDLPQFRPTTTPGTTITNQATGTAPVDLRGLGASRTLTLLNGRRFIGDNNLNFVPVSLVRRVDVVTGGASAAYGSGAVAGVVNIILDDKFEGVRLGAQSGITPRGDGARYRFDGALGVSFAGGKGNLVVGAEYVTDGGFGPASRTSRPNLGAGIIPVNPTSATDKRSQLTADVNFGNSSLGGLITSGVLAGQVFNSDGILRPFRGGTQVGSAAFNANQIGGIDATSIYDNFYLSAPLDRFTSYARLTYDVGGASIWVDGNFGRSVSDYAWVPDITLTSLTVSAANPFLSQTIRDQLAAAGQTSFTLGRFFPDAYTTRLRAVRTSYEGAVGIDGNLGRFKYSAHYSHGEMIVDSQATGGRISAKYANAINAVAGAGGAPVCAINADAVTTNDDPACVPINPFGYGNVSAAAVAYTTGTQTAWTINKLDVAGAQIQGDIFSLPAGPLTAVVGGELRYESQGAQPGTVATSATFAIPVFTSALTGKFNVKEAFGELVVPVIDAQGVFKLDLNGAARYSYYSTSGGIWSWKAGATVRLFNDLLIRGTRSRDIRSPNVSELYSTQRLGFGSVTDAQFAKYSGTLGYNSNPTLVRVISGGNPNLVPEIGSTLTVGATYSPSFLRGFSASIDYYDISVAGAIFTLSGSQLTQACNGGSVAACGAITRDSTGTVASVLANSQNLANFATRGLDFEISYVTPLSTLSSKLDGTLTMRGLATYVDRYIVDTGVTATPTDTAGDVGNTVSNGIPHWRGIFSVGYQSAAFGFDTRVRFVGGGKFDHLQAEKTVAGVTTGLINNDIGSRTYVDIGAQFRVAKRFELFGSVNNVFNVAPPLTTSVNANYDVIGTYLNFGAKVRF